MMTSKLVRTGILGLFAASLGVMGCASGDTGSASSDQLQGDDPAAQEPSDADRDASRCRSYSGRAVAATVTIGNPNGLDDYSDNIFISDTKALPKDGGHQTASLATINAGNLLKAAVFNGSTEGAKGQTDSRASVANAALFGGSTAGILGDVLGEDGQGGTISIDLRKILSDLGVSDLVENVFGKGKPLELGIRADVVEEDARAWCDKRGKAHSAARVKILNLSINDRPIRVSTEPNQIIDLGIAKVIINAQWQSKDGGTIHAAALRVNVADIIDVKVARASAGVKCD